MTPNRIMMLNCALFVAIVGIAAFLSTEQRTVPGAPPLDDLDTVTDETNTGPQQRGDAYPDFGRKDVFAQLIPRPTPTPRPSPTPEPPPEIDKVIQYWRLQGVIDGIALVQDMKSNEDFSMKVGESKPVEYRGETYDIFLERAKLREFKAVFTLTVKGQKQSKELKSG